MYNKLNELKDKMTSMKEEFKNNGQQVVKDTLNEFFTAHPEVVKVSWTGSTPSWNDGDPCYYGISYLSFYTNDTNDEDEEYEEDEYDYYSLAEDNNLQHDAKELQDLFHDMQDVLEIVFGDPVRVIATRDNMTVEEYDNYY